MLLSKCHGNLATAVNLFAAGVLKAGERVHMCCRMALTDHHADHCAPARLTGGCSVIHFRRAAMSVSVFDRRVLSLPYRRALFTAMPQTVAGLRPLLAQYASSSEMMS